MVHSKDVAKLAQIAALEDLQHWQGIWKHFTAENFLEMGSGVMDFIDLPMGCLMLSSTLFIYNKTP